MIYANWKPDKKSVGNLFLDPRNPRIPPSAKPLSESELIEELVIHDDVHELARNIAANGFFPSEPLICARENGKLYVIEGNRRLAACKLLVSPEGAPVAYHSKFKALAAGFDVSSVKAVPVLIAPSRESTIPLIIARHTSVQVQRWEPAMQAAFYSRLLKEGLSIPDVAKKFNLTAGEIRDALRQHNLYQVACALPFAKDVADIVRNPRNFNLTTLGRIFESPVGRKFFGVEFTDEGDLQGTIHPDEFKRGFSKVVTDIATAAVDSRTLNSPAQISEYLDNFSQNDKPDLSRTGTFSSASLLGQGIPKRPAAAPKGKKKGTPKRIPVGLIPAQFQCALSNQRVQNLFDELKHLSPERFPNACALSFRCFLELSVYCFLDGKGEISNMKSEALATIAAKNAKLPPGKPRRTLPPHWSPTLNEMLKRIADPHHCIIPQGQVTKALNKTIHDEQELFSLNLFAHNIAYNPSAPRLRTAWANLEEFFKLILT
jgi:hypothetical protein